EEVDIERIDCDRDSLDVELIRAFAADWVAIDSYWIAADAISRLNEEVPCVAIIDGDNRGIDATLYVDQNLGAETMSWPENVRTRLLSGARFSMIRDAVLDQRRAQPEKLRHNPAHVVTFMGGTD